MLSWLQRQWARLAAPVPSPHSQKRAPGLLLERLEDCTLPSAAVLSDINRGPGSSAPAFLNGERWFTEVQSANGQSRVFFVANDGQRGDELWVSDGTSNGTTMVRDIANGSSNPRFLVNVSGTLFFVANDGQNGFELWRSDGTSNGTVMVANIYPGANSSNPHWLLNAGGVLFFSADDGSGFRLGRFNPTANSLTFIADPPPPTPGINFTIRRPQWLTYFPGIQRLFYVAELRRNNVFQGTFIWLIGQTSGGPPTQVIGVSDPGNNGFFLTAVVDPTRPPNQGSFLFYRNRVGVLPVLDARCY